MEEIIKVYEYALSINKDLKDQEIWCSKEIYDTIEEKEYKGLPIYTSQLMPKDYICIGQLYYK